MAGPDNDDVRFDGLGLWLAAPDDGDPVVRILERATAAARAAERAGFGSVWVSESAADGPGGVPYEAYSLLGALAVATGRVRLGAVTDGTERRAPSILAKIVTGVDVISHGRAILSLDGDGAAEADPERLDEASSVCRVVLRDESPTYSGRIYTVDGAVNRPRPVQAGGVPIVVFVHGDGPGRSGVLEVAVRSTDAVVVDGGADGVRDAVRAVAEHRRGGAGPAGRVEVVGTARGGAEAGLLGLGEQVRSVRAAGGTGCLVCIPYPWDPEIVEDPSITW
jgi:alkanesulfonate monooxygenase SsuD/methylene tetrahydromethanopterin reductase-like flavin-dependent oxidoreductase (luciferase family)